MLREVATAHFERRLTWVGRRYRLVLGRDPVGPSWRPGRFRRLQRERVTAAILLLRDGRRSWWLVQDRILREDEGLTAEDVWALEQARARRRRRTLERAHEAVRHEREPARRRGIPREIRRIVYERDGGRCTACGSAFDLQYDHVIPLARGGGDAVQNLQLLCGACNGAKGAALA